MPFALFDHSYVTCSARPENPRREEAVPMARSPELTLLDVIQAVSEVAANEQEILATVVHLISSGQVRLSDDAVRALRALCAPADAAA
jgi:hypothetical protein